MIPVGYQMWIAVDWLLNEEGLIQIAYAMHEYHDEHQHFPAPAIYDKDGKALLSWRVELLPYVWLPGGVRGLDLYKEFHLEEPWDSPHNIRLLSRMPTIYEHRGPNPPPANMTYFRAFVTPPKVSPRSVFVEKQTTTMGFIKDHDGIENTILVVEAADAVPWTKPEELLFLPNKPLPPLGGHFATGFTIVVCDTGLRRIRPDFDEIQLRAAITCNGGEKVEWEKLGRR
jgi:hypothetical protein